LTKLQSICVAFSCLLLAPLAHAQPAKLQRIGVIHEGGPYEATVQGMVAGLKQAGLVEGKHFLLHVRDLKGSLRDIEGVAKQLVSERVDLLFTVTTSVTLAAKKATRDIPIVFYAGSDPVRVGLVKSYAKPGDRLTGVHQPAVDLVPKRLDILKQLLPGARRVVTFYNVENPISAQSLAEARGVAARLGIELIERPVRSVDDVVAGVRALRAGEADAYFQTTDVTVFVATPRIIDLARERRLPMLIGDLNSLQNGVLAAYGVNYFEVGRFAAKHVQRVLLGAKPQDLPVEIYDQVQLGLNLRVARELGITVPQPLILRADLVIR